MSPEQLVAVLTAVTALVVAAGGIIVQLRQLRKDLNGRMSQLVETTAMAAGKEGELTGRDYEQKLHAAPIDPAGRENIRSVDEPSRP